jgi:hypothetical protein
MLGCDAADLVAIARHGDKREEDEIVVTRVNLDEPTTQHRKHWFEVIVPRLYKISSFVNELRIDEEARHHFVTCNDVERWRILSNHLGYINLNDHKEYHNAAAAAAISKTSTNFELELALQLSLDDAANRKRTRRQDLEKSVSSKKRCRLRRKGNKEDKEEVIVIDLVNRTRSGCIYSPIKKLK